MDEVLAAMHGVQTSKMGALAARSRHFKRLGFPVGANVGKGRASAYGPEQIIGLLLAFEISQFGTNPEQVVKILIGNPTLPVQVAAHFIDQAKGNEKPNFIVHLDPHAMSGLGDGEGNDPRDISQTDALDFADRFLTGENRFYWRRRALIDTGQMLAQATHVISTQAIRSAEDFVAAMAEWVDQVQRERSNALDKLLEGKSDGDD
jgi:hypothetical protein